MTCADRQRTIRPLAADELKAVLAAAEKGERRLYPYLLTMARAGLRPSEGLALRGDDLSFKGREVRVERSLDATGRVVAIKTGLVRTVDMSVGLATALQRLRSERAAETQACLARSVLAQTGEASWLPALRPPTHVRHRAARAGAPITYVAAQLGHTKPTTTLQGYAHWLPRADKHWVDALDNATSKTLGDQLVTNRVVGAENAVRWSRRSDLNR
jgi:integrase